VTILYTETIAKIDRAEIRIAHTLHQRCLDKTQVRGSTIFSAEAGNVTSHRSCFQNPGGCTVFRDDIFKIRMLESFPERYLENIDAEKFSEAMFRNSGGPKVFPGRCCQNSAAKNFSEALLLKSGEQYGI